MAIKKIQIRDMAFSKSSIDDSPQIFGQAQNKLRWSLSVRSSCIELNYLISSGIDVDLMIYSIFIS